MSVVAPGISAAVSAPVTYKMTYLNGTFSYTEPFYLLRFEPAWVRAAGLAVDLVMNRAVEALAGLGPIGVAVGVLAKWGWHWFSKAQIDSDGGLTIRCAAHYCGGRQGVDVTATPIPGMPASHWNETLRNLMTGVRGRHEQATNAVESGDLAGASELGLRADRLDKPELEHIRERLAKLSSADLAGHIAWIAESGHRGPSAELLDAERVNRAAVTASQQDVNR